MFLPKNLGGYEDIDVSPGLVESMASIISQRSSENPMLINMVKEDGSKWCVVFRFYDEATWNLIRFIASSPLCPQGMRRVQHSFAAGTMSTNTIPQ